jgi:hypothetical protein
MDRAIIVEHLKIAERHIAEGEALIARQSDLLAQLEREGDRIIVAEAKKLMTRFEEIQRLHLADRDRLRAELRAL